MRFVKLEKPSRNTLKSRHENKSLLATYFYFKLFLVLTNIFQDFDYF